MTRVATYNARGMHAGQVVVLRHVEGAQRWRVHIVTERANGQRDDYSITADKPVPLSAMTDIVLSNIAEMCGPGELLRNAKLDFYITTRGRAPQRKRA